MIETKTKINGSNKKKIILLKKNKESSGKKNTKDTKNDNLIGKLEYFDISADSKKDKKRSEKKDQEKKSLTYKDYLDLENSRLILSYGPQVYDYSRLLENMVYGKNEEHLKHVDILKIHEISPQIRTKLIDWLFEVLYAYKSDESCIYLTMHLLDTYIMRCKTRLTNNDLHLLGITSLFIASKAEDMTPLDMNTLKKKIGHDKFSEKDFKKKERQILEMTDYGILGPSIYEFIQNFIYDFCFNNSKTIRKLKMKGEIQKLESTAIYISKVILHSEIFYGYKSSLKAIACIVVAFDLVRSNITSFNQEIESFTHEWINFLIEQSKFEPKHISTVYTQISEYYNSFDKIPLIQHNLKKNINLPF